MESIVGIKDISGNILQSVPLTEPCEHVEELMQSDHITLSWESDQSDILPIGAYIEYKGEKYSLLEPYSPIQNDELKFTYQPQFKSVLMSWGKIPFFMYTYSADNEIINREPDWELTDNPVNFMSVICKGIKNETGEEWTYSVDASLPASATLSFQSVDVFSALNSIANAFETEWWADKANKVLHLSKAEHGTPITLKVGVNINTPSVTNSKEGYYTRFYAFGSTRNIVQDYNGANVNNLVNKRLTLDPIKYPDGYKDIKPGLQKGEIFSKILIFDDIYPSSKLTISDVRVRLMWTIDESTGEKIQVGTDDDGNPIYDQYAIWYFRIPGFTFNNTTYSKDNPTGMLIAGKTLSAHFETGALQGREFELIYHDKAETVSSADGTSIVLSAGDYEIKFKEEGTYIIPAITALIPSDGDHVILFNIRMPQEYVNAAYTELENAMDKEIARLSSDLNNYQFSSNPVVFYENNPGLSLGRKVTYVNGDYSYSTRVIKLVTKLDYENDCKQDITIGNDKIKGNTQEIKEEVASANKDINLLAVINDMTSSLQQSYQRTQKMMLEGFASIKDMWRFDPKIPDTIFSKYNVYTEKALSSKGLSLGDGSGGDGSATALYQLNDVAKNESGTNVLGAAPGKVLTYGEDGKWYAADAVGLDETALASYLTSNNYAKKSDIPSLSGYATENWVNAQLNNKVDNVVGMGLSHNDFTDALLAKLNGIAEGANNYILPVAKAAVLGGVMVGSTLTASATGVLNLPEVMTAGTYAKVTTDAYGRVTGGFSLSASDIPTLSVSKIAGLQDALDKKIDKSDFATEFDKAMQRWFVRDTANKGLHPADYDSEAVGLYSDSYISSKGVNPGTGGGTEGASSLGELNNVGSWADTIPTADRIMVQRKGATHWESLNLSDIGLNETQLGDYLTTNNYAKKSDIPSLSGYATEKWVLGKGYITSAALTGYATQSWVNTQLRGYATSSALKAVSDKLDDFLTGTDTDNVINKWKELEAFLAGFQETDTLAGALTLKADKAIAISAGTGLSGGGDLSANRTLSLNTASATALGGIKVGNRLSIDANGVLSATYTYTLPTASATVLGGVKVGTTLNMAASGVLDIKATGTAGTYFKVTTDAYGRVTSGSNPTTLAGFGITDGVNAVKVNGAGNAVTSYSLSGHNLTLVKGTTFLTKAAFDDLFEKVNIGTSAAPVYAIRAKYGFYTDGFISSKGLNPGTGGSGGGSDYDRLDAWSDYTADKAGYVLSAGLGNDLNTRLKAVEVNGAVKVTTLGSGNVVTAVSQSGNVITFTKGITALTAHQSLANYVTLNTEQEILAVKTFRSVIKKKTATITRSVVTNDPSNDALIFGDVLDYIVIRGKGIRFQNTVAKSNIKFENDGEITASKFIKSGGTASQFLMADGSVKALSDITSAYVTALGTSGNYLTWTKNGVTNNITVPYASNADKLGGYSLISFAGRSTASLPANGIVRIALSLQSCFISVIGTNGNRTALVWVSGYGEGTTLRNKAKIIHAGGNYSFYINGSSEKGCVYVKSSWGNDTDTVFVTFINGGRSAITAVSAVPSDAELIGNSDTLATLTDNVASATKLATARTLWGKSFNGTANVSGAIQIWGATSATPSLTDEPRLEFAEAAGTQKVALVYSSYDSYRADAGIKVISDQKTVWFECPNIYGALKGNANTATALQTARTINGTSFNGSANIVTSYWGTARNIKIGEVTKSVNGSANVEFTRNDMKVAAGAEVSYVGTTTANSWYRIASSPVGIANSTSILSIEAVASGRHSNIILYAGISYGNTASASLNILGSSAYTNGQIQKVRIVYTTSYSGNYAYLEVQATGSISTTFYVKRVIGSGNWTLLSSLTAGSIPSGYLSKEITPYSGGMTNTGNVHSMGYLESTLNGNTIQIGSQNATYAHFSSSKPFWFNTGMEINGYCYPYTNNSFTLGSSSKRWSNVYATAGNFSNYIDIGSIRLTYDSTNNAIKVSKTDGTAAGLYTEGFLSSKGLNAGSGTGGGGTDYDRLDAWSDYAASKAGWVLSAGLGNDLNTRLKAVEVNGAVKVSTTGSGNAVTAVGQAGNVITFTKGATFSLSSHTHSYLPLAGGTITGTLGKSNNYLFKPNGGDYRTTTSTVTGAICISLPANIGDTMISMWIDVYNYVTNTSFSVHVGGYTYNTKSTFVNAPFAMVYGATHKVRLTYDNGFKIYIGETNSTWSYPQVSVRDVVLGFKPTYSNWLNSWSVSFVTSFPATINAVLSGYAYTTLNKPRFSDITSKPTTLAGYGITDAVTIGTAQTITGRKTFSTGIIAKQNNDFIVNSNEFNFVPSGYSADVHFNYRTAGGANGAIGKYMFRDGKNGYAGIYASSIIKHGGTVSQFLMADGSVATKKTLGAVDSSGWVNAATDDLKVPTMSFIAYWNGRYDSSKSNLQYCDRGRFGDIVTLSLSDILASNVASATKLATARTIWGQSFNGTANVSGALSGATTISASGVIATTSLDPGFRVISGSTNKLAMGYRSSDAGAYIYNYVSSRYLGVSDNATPVFGIGGNCFMVPHTRKLFSKNDYEHWVVLLCETTSTAIGVHRVTGKVFTEIGGSTRYQAADINLWYSRWSSTGADNHLVLNTYGQGTPWNLVTCTYGGKTYYALQHTNIQAVSAYFVGTFANALFTAVKYYTAAHDSTAAVVNNSEINSSIKDVTTSVLSANGTTYALTSSNVASATKLQTARTLWGQSFNGTANVSGNMTGVGTIAFSNGQQIYCPEGEFNINGTNSGTLTRWVSMVGGNVGIGTTSPSNKLEVSGSVKATGYFYSDGWFQNNVANKGLYNSAGDARWYWNGTGWYSDKAIIVKDRLDIDTTGRISPHATSTRRAGVYGVYDSTKIGHIWSMGTAYVIADDGSNFGNLYGFAYKHTNNTTGGTMAGGHQAVWCVNGTPKVAMGDNLWTSGSTTTSKIIVSSTDKTNHLAFSRGDYNYITAPTSGTIAFVVNGQSVGSATAELTIQKGSIFPGTTNATSLGTSTYRWSNTYTQLLNVAGAATLSGAVSVGSTLTLSSGLSAQYSGGSWLSMATRTNVIYGNQNTSQSSAHALYRVKSYGGHAVAFGGLGNNIGFYGFYKARIDAGTNGTDWSTVWDTTTGNVTHNKALILSTTGEVLKLTGTATKKIWLTGNTDSNWGQIEGLYTPVSNLGHNVLMNIAVGLGGLQLSSTNGTLMIIGQSEILAKGVLHNTTGMYSDGYVSSKGQNTSDARLKTDIKSFNATSIIKSLRPVSFKWNNLARKNNKVFDTDEVQYGLIAQEVKTVAPWAAVDNMFKDGYMGVRYEKFIPVIMKAQIETIDEVEGLKRRLSAVERENEKLRKEIQLLKAA